MWSLTKVENVLHINKCLYLHQRNIHTTQYTLFRLRTQCTKCICYNWESTEIPSPTGKTQYIQVVHTTTFQKNSITPLNREELYSENWRRVSFRNNWVISKEEAQLQVDTFVLKVCCSHVVSLAFKSEIVEVCLLCFTVQLHSVYCVLWSVFLEIMPCSNFIFLVLINKLILTFTRLSLCFFGFSQWYPLDSEKARKCFKTFSFAIVLMSQMCWFFL